MEVLPKNLETTGGLAQSNVLITRIEWRKRKRKGRDAETHGCVCRGLDSFLGSAATTDLNFSEQRLSCLITLPHLLARLPAQRPPFLPQHAWLPCRHLLHWTSLICPGDMAPHSPAGLLAPSLLPHQLLNVPSLEGLFLALLFKGNASRD